VHYKCLIDDDDDDCTLTSSGCCYLWSANTHHRIFPWSRTSHGDCSFFIHGFVVWNGLSCKLHVSLKK